MLYSIGLVLNSFFFLFVCACFVLPSFQIKSYASSVSFLQILHFGWKFFMSYTFFFRETTGVILCFQLKFGVCLIPIEDVGTALFCFVRISPYA